MTNPNFYRPTDPAAKKLLLRVEAGPFDREERLEERLSARWEALTDGVPGFVRDGSMSPGQALAYAARMQLGPIIAKDHKNYVANPRIVSVYHDTEARQSQLVGMAVYGSSLTEWGAQGRFKGEEPAHMNTCHVLSQGGDKRFSRSEQYAIGTLLVHAVAVDAINNAAVSHTRLDYNAGRSQYNWLAAEAERLGLQGQLEEDTYVWPGADFVVPVQNERAVDRCMLSLPTQALAEALVAQNVWIQEQ